ncbi:helix-turn-helix transcriptional regulator [Nocardia abscessus]|uniref:helix-turn-helix transcriptional regulator n=1 Tax=Nocardia abscessus TaxID=120957 RepID=UPI0024585AE0|nr:helix-turn-helix transcriptional regulator [Nocardia abscessus]
MKGVSWEESKRRAREIDPAWDSPDRVASRDESREQMRAEQRGHQLAELRKQCGATQAQVAELMGVSGQGVADRARQNHVHGLGS